MIEQIKKSVAYLKENGFGSAPIGIILGTGLGKLLDSVTIEREIGYDQIPHFPTATVEFHQGKLIFGEIAGKKVIVMQGRFHFYEGYSMQDITYPIRVMEQLGIKTLLVSNAAGAVNLHFKKGELMLMDDHINLQGDSPLAFKEVSALGERFVDMSEPYDKTLNLQLKAIADKKNILLHEGVYASVKGPQLETRAEYRMLKTLGADVVGMSTVPEVIVANQLKLKVATISVITDDCDPDNLNPVDIQDIMTMAAQAEPNLVELFKTVIQQI